MPVHPVAKGAAEEVLKRPLLWLHGWARGVERDALRAHLGTPFYVETDSHRTFGGDEDWWFYEDDTGEMVAVCLRVPYGDAVLYSSSELLNGMPELVALLSPWTVEIFEKPYAR